MQLTITQQPQNGFLGGPHAVSFSIELDSVQYDVYIEQYGKRTISITTKKDSYNKIMTVYNALETLLMLFDGQFYPVTEAFDGANITDSWKKRELPSHISADFMISEANKLIGFETILDETIFQKWIKLSVELDLVHKMVLYCLSAVEMPTDMKCAFMIEAFKGLYGLVHKQDPTFVAAIDSEREPSLKAAFIAIVDRYGLEVFGEECLSNKEQFVQILVNSRNRIAHIKSKGKRILDGLESIEYLLKLSLVYRIALFDLLGISKVVYEQSLKSSIEVINNHAPTKRLNKYLKGLTPKVTPSTDEKLVLDIYSLLYDFAYSTALYRTIRARGKKKYNQREIKEHLWNSLSDNCIQQAVTDWCKVFGSNNERTHYSKIYPAFTNDFEQKVKEIGIDLCEYSKGMKNFRDTFIAHRDEKRNRRPIPDLDPALTICYLYEQIVLCSIPGTIPFGLESFYNGSKADISRYMDSIGVQKI